MMAGYTAASMYGLPAPVQPTGTGSPAADPAVVSMNAKTAGGLWASPVLWLVIVLAVALGLVAFSVRVTV